jgi:hypothetical protein
MPESDLPRAILEALGFALFLRDETRGDVRRDGGCVETCLNAAHARDVSSSHFMNARFLLAAALAFAVVAQAETPPPELDALKLYAGKWDVAVTDNASVKGEANGQWILEGRFLQQSWSLDTGTPDAPKLSGTTLMTYDSTKRIYRAWHYFSNGSFAEADGTWDEASRLSRGRDATPPRAPPSSPKRPSMGTLRNGALSPRKAAASR